MTTVRTDTNAVNTSNPVAAVIAPTFSAEEDVLAVAPTGLSYASPIRVTSQRRAAPEGQQ